MAKTDTEWKYYLPENGSDADDARPILLPSWRHKIIHAEDAATLASEQEWDDGGYESGIDATPLIAVIDPKGSETRWRAHREVDVAHSVVDADQ